MRRARDRRPLLPKAPRGQSPDPGSAAARNGSPRIWPQTTLRWRRLASAHATFRFGAGSALPDRDSLRRPSSERRHRSRDPRGVVYRLAWRRRKLLLRSGEFARRVSRGSRAQDLAGTPRFVGGSYLARARQPAQFLSVLLNLGSLKNWCATSECAGSLGRPPRRPFSRLDAAFAGLVAPPRHSGQNIISGVLL